ncbi:uncharacterized protein BDZ99DRAFT_274026 [Mytilinidion resinicola]|uniref:Uncharacterized protein n=1 Tax=Mytilinidion resinicola TaxID=574789 RepID=A0A6A6YS49_9PEZI|nr:uncharacterized protein BDZ99DRAFT_274026 [Mytilinidion resinicola]KAF2811339.1 hypothetical protein BDZ99DRAFT_274026 [Mytilinidion resinicola]
MRANSAILCILQISITFPKRRATMPVTSKLVTAAPSNARAATTSPSSPSQPLSRHGESEQLAAFELVALFKDMLKISQAAQEVPPPSEVQVIEEKKQPRTRASKVEFKLVNEMYAPKTEIKCVQANKVPCTAGTLERNELNVFQRIGNIHFGNREMGVQLII